MIQAGKLLNSIISPIAGNTSMKLAQRQQIHQLRKNGSAYIHKLLPPLNGGKSLSGIQIVSHRLPAQTQQQQ
jgi:hypothetical protein